MRAAPDKDAECTNECLFGERVERFAQATDNPDVLDPRAQDSIDRQQQNDWLLVRANRDNYCGYIQRRHLQVVDSTSADPTHRVATRSTLVFSEASIKSRVLHRLPFLSHISVASAPAANFVQLTTGGFIWSEHLMQIHSCWQGPVLQLAESHFLGAPYLWGGCTPQGLDCSGLVQALATAKGLNIPRNSIDQENALANTVVPGEQRAEDIVYWPGHTGLLVSPDRLLHATAHFLSCVVEPLDDVISRAGAMTSIKRLFDKQQND